MNRIRVGCVREGVAAKMHKILGMKKIYFPQISLVIPKLLPINKC